MLFVKTKNFVWVAPGVIPPSGFSQCLTLIFVSSVTSTVAKPQGVDEIHPEMLKAFGVEGLSWLTRLINIACKSGAVPKEWQTGVAVPLFQSLYAQSESCVQDQVEGLHLHTGLRTPQDPPGCGREKGSLESPARTATSAT